MSQWQSSINNYYDSVIKDYDRFYGVTQHGRLHIGYHDARYTGKNAELENLDRAMAEFAHITSGEHVLDAGCGLGGTAVFLAQNFGARVTGINISDLQLGYARQAAAKNGLSDKLEFKNADIIRTDMPDESVNVYYACESLVHAEGGPISMFKEAYRVLKPGGRIVLSEAMLTGDAQVRERESWRLPHVDNAFGNSRHVVVDDVQARMAEAGFAEVTIQDATENVTPAARKLRMLTMVGIPYAWVLHKLRLRPDTHVKAGMALYHMTTMFMERTMRYILMRGTKR
jgi:tocopherol O-methyltransferase